MRKGLAIFLLAAFLSTMILLTACTPNLPSASLPANTDVEVEFREVYGILEWEGEYILGDPISGLCQVPGTEIKKEYFENGVLIYDSNRSPRYYLEAVNLPSGGLVPLDSVPSTARNIGGYTVLEEFIPLYEEFGERWLGEPTTSTLWNSTQGRYEQYFENFAIYHYENHPEIGFIPSGTTRFTSANCTTDTGSSAIGLDTINSTSSANIANKARAGYGEDIVGSALSGEFVGQDGRREVVFENVAVYDSGSGTMGISLRPLPSLLGIAGDAGGSGYDVPDYFDDFIRLHSGYEVSGNPISSLQDMGGGVKQQCFENYCLKHDPNVSQNVTLLPLGREYLKKVDTSITSLQPTQPSVPIEQKPATEQTSSLNLLIWVLHPEISSAQPQTFGACVLDESNPVQDYRATLSVSGGSDYSLSIPNDKGCAFAEIPPIEASDGSTIDYEVCITTSWGETLCERDSFYIWGNP